jgi:hypothetical protein
MMSPGPSSRNTQNQFNYVDAEVHSPIEYNQSSSQPINSTVLSPHKNSPAVSNSASHSHNVASTPSNSLSEYGTYQSSELDEFDDEFFGVEFSTDVLQDQLLSYDQVSSHMGGLYEAERTINTPPDPLQAEDGHSQVIPLSPPPDSAFETEFTTEHKPVSQLEPTTEMDNQSSQSFTKQVNMNNPMLMSTVGHGDTKFNDYVKPVKSSLQLEAPRDDEGIGMSNEKTGLAGLDPERRKQIADTEIPNLKEQDVQRRLDAKNFDNAEWMSQTGGSSDFEDEIEFYSRFSSHQLAPDDENDNRSVDDAISVHENRLVKGQVYYNIGATPNQSDMEMIRNQARQWSDAPALHYITNANFLQLETANESMKRYNEHAETISLLSRQATWGTRRHSEPSLSDLEAIENDSFLKKLAISKPKDGNHHRRNSIFDQESRLSDIIMARHKINDMDATVTTPTTATTHLGFARSVIKRARSKIE